MHTHRCNTEHPERPCCWAARKREFAALEAADDARIAKYGSLACPKCGAIYGVTHGVVEDHDAVCRPLTDAERMR